MPGSEESAPSLGLKRARAAAKGVSAGVKRHGLNIGVYDDVRHSWDELGMEAEAYRICETQIYTGAPGIQASVSKSLDPRRKTKRRSPQELKDSFLILCNSRLS